MSGPQFFHLQSYSRKENKAGQSVEQVLAEAARVPEFSEHVESPNPPNLIFGIAPEEVKIQHDAMVEQGYVEVTLADASIARRSVRKDRHTLMTVVASYPLLTEQVTKGSEGYEAYQEWIALNVRWLKLMFGDRLVSVIEHVDENHPHIHAFILPIGDQACSARQLNPAWEVKVEAEAIANESGHSAKAAVKLGNAAYRAKARELQDEYYQHVGIPTGLTRTGPKRERLSRSQWKQRKERAKKDADLLRQMSARVEGISNAQAQLDADEDQSAAEITKMLTLAKTEAQLILEQAEIRSASLKQRARTEIAEISQKLDRQATALQAERHAFEDEKRRVLKDTVLLTASVIARVLIGILSGDVRLNKARTELSFNDIHLAEDMQRLEIAPLLRKAIEIFSQVWERLTGYLPAADAKKERERISEDLKPLARPPSRGIEP
jgi:hypothetical protein